VPTEGIIYEPQTKRVIFVDVDDDDGGLDLPGVISNVNFNEKELAVAGGQSLNESAFQCGSNMSSFMNNSGFGMGINNDLLNQSHLNGNNNVQNMNPPMLNKKNEATYVVTNHTIPQTVYTDNRQQQSKIVDSETLSKKSTPYQQRQQRQEEQVNPVRNKTLSLKSDRNEIFANTSQIPAPPMGFFDGMTGICIPPPDIRE